MNFIRLYSRMTLQEELRIMAGLGFYIADSAFLAGPVRIGNLDLRMQDRLSTHGPAYGWGYYYDFFVENLFRWLE